MPEVLKQRLSDCPDLESVLASALSIGLELSGTGLGNIQLMDPSARYLTIAAQCGFNDEFLNFFRRVRAFDGSACGRAIRMRRPIVIGDVLVDSEFAPCRGIALKAGFRAVQSFPLVSSEGSLLGVLSTHFSTTRRPVDSEMLIMQRLAELTAETIAHQRARAQSINGAGHLTEQVKQGHDATERFDDLIGCIARKPEP